jgi:hypothetical protein
VSVFDRSYLHFIDMGRICMVRPRALPLKAVPQSQVDSLGCWRLCSVRVGLMVNLAQRSVLQTPSAAHMWLGSCRAPCFMGWPSWARERALCCNITVYCPHP